MAVEEILTIVASNVEHKCTAEYQKVGTVGSANQNHWLHGRKNDFKSKCRTTKIKTYAPTLVRPSMCPVYMSSNTKQHNELHIQLEKQRKHATSDQKLKKTYHNGKMTCLHVVAGVDNHMQPLHVIVASTITHHTVACFSTTTFCTNRKTEIQLQA
jgi:hypothetical protein